MRYDLLVKRGTVVDPSQGLNSVRDVAFSAGKVAAVESHISDHQAVEVLDASGLFVTPGLIDFHIHAFWGASDWGVNPDPTNVARGVTTALDAGTAGVNNFPAFRRYVLERAATRLYALVNISSVGVISRDVGELCDLRWANVERAVQVARENNDLVVGIKARLGRLQAGDNGEEALKLAVEAAEAAGVFVMVHIGDTPSPLEEIVAALRPGDVVTHTFHGHRHGILDGAGRVLDGVREAQERGVIFDVAHGMGSFSFAVAEKALTQGFVPGIISSDLHAFSVEGPVFDQLTVLSKFMYLGMSLEEVVRLSTEAPARMLGTSDRLGTLRVGSEGDATVLSVDEGNFVLTDAMGVSVQARRRLRHVRTVRQGKIYRPWLS